MILRKDTRVFVQLGYTDMRKQINGLSALVQAERSSGPFDGSYYVFCGKTKKVIKVLYWDRTGFCLWLKRLEKDSFPWPQGESDLTEITRNQIRLLLRGIDIWKAHKEVQCSIAG
ncbi:IS66 family insertion sequence element accessory protein TnpB [Treponema zuelzerae]|uniref:IS66 family insertion sequence element accessory protein TnpB n=2 Tax=Teretinema zuelzerae TaxID=156 RepID=A0AAE3EM36_9SPIR|nr:IS66 family insertion sequence element accessory protein TnpB [Teretinema zuelzerae]MCD1655938.1 IS66 family insertion sequence element accessory protein TnpB [Teretinema zuelzerae]MCD1655988.1 IS66 family insertion sequence element accessory protein TnpB [Teretinema zuelzerae]